MLATKFPDIKFSVKSTRGNSIDVRWTDGPTWDAVRAVAGQLHGTDFDGMTDGASGNGRPYGNDYIFFTRDHSDAALLAAVRWYQETWKDERAFEFVASTPMCQSYVRTAFYEIEERIYRHMREQDFCAKSPVAPGPTKEYYCSEHKYNPAPNSGLCFCPKCEFPEAFEPGPVVTNDTTAKARMGVF